MAGLSNSELLILNNVLGFNIEFAQGDTVADLLNELEERKKELAGGTTSLEEIEEFLTGARARMEANPEFGEYVVHSVQPRIHDEAAPIVTFVNGDDAVVCFWGTTGAEEWYDNVKAAGNYFTTDMTDPEKGSVYQEAASAYVNEIAKTYKNLTVTGHSKGGNKAQYAALMCPEVDRCVSFDGQGFSVAFIEQYKDLIEQRRDIIVSISADNDIVNALLPSIAGTVLYVDTSDVPKEYLDGFFHYHKPNILLNSDGELRNTDGVQTTELAKLIHDFTIYISKIKNDQQRELAIELAANIASDVMRHGGKKDDVEAALNRVLDLENAEAMALIVAYGFEFAEERELSYQEVLQTLSVVLGDTSKFNKWYMAILWDALFDASKQVSVDEFVSLITQVRDWGRQNGLSSWDQLVEYVREDPVRIIELYSSLDLEKATVNDAVGSFVSTNNVSALISGFVANHPIISTIGAAALSIPVVREQVAALAAVTAAIGVVALTVNHVIQNWDKIVSAVKQTAEYIKDEIVKFYNSAKQAVTVGMNNWLSSVLKTAERYITYGSRVVNKIVDVSTDFWDSFKDFAMKSVDNMMRIGCPAIYVVSSKIYREVKEPVRVNIQKIRDCVSQMNVLANRVALIDERLDNLYWWLAQDNIEQGEGLFTSLANIYNLFRADLNVDEGASIRRKARALSTVFGEIEATESWVQERVPKGI